MEISVILEKYGMSGKKAAEVMGISYGYFRKCRSDKSDKKFKDKHLDKLKQFLKI